MQTYGDRYWKQEVIYFMVNIQKAAIIGCGFVGSSIAFELMQKGIFSELVLLDVNTAKAQGEAMDLSHGLPYTKTVEIYAGDYDTIKDCALIIITAGANQKPNETRLDLIDKNVGILKSVIPEIRKRDCEGILLIVSNPVDVLTYAAYRLSGFPANRVIGSGTVLDTARLKYLLGKELQVDSRSVHAAIIGEHGDSELAVWSAANVSGIELETFWHYQKEYYQKMELKPPFTTAAYQDMLQKIYKDVRDSAYEIIEKKGATYYGIAMAVGRIAESIVRNEHSILPISVLANGEYGLEELCLSLPSLVGQNGLEEILPIPLDEKEKAALHRSADQLKEVIRHIGL